MYEFCTLFDRHYLARGVVLARSLAETCASFRLRVFCMDGPTKTLLDRMALPGVVTIGLGELEAADRELRAVRPARSRIEYCWTATPASCLHALEREPELNLITYLDADLMFFSNPRPIFQELGAASILLTAHRFAEDREAREQLRGIFNVQFTTFRRDGHGLAALRWWRERCLEWCSMTPVDGRWGDQKYLDDWPERFGGVHVLEHPGALAPWNAAAHRLERRDGRTLVDGQPLVFFHYATLGLYRGVAALRRLGLLASHLRLVREPLPLVWRGAFPVSGEEEKLIWEPYLRRLGRAIADVQALAPGFDAGIERIGPWEAARWGMRARLGLPNPARRW